MSFVNLTSDILSFFYSYITIVMVNTFNRYINYYQCKNLQLFVAQAYENKYILMERGGLAVVNVGTLVDKTLS